MQAQSRQGTATTINKQDTGFHSHKVLTIRGLISRGRRGGCLEHKPTRTSKIKDASNMFIPCLTTIDLTRPSHQRLQVATPIMRAIRPILRVATTALSSGDRQRNASSNLQTTMALASARARHTRTRMLSLLGVRTVDLQPGTRYHPRLAYSNSSNSRRLPFLARMRHQY